MSKVISYPAMRTTHMPGFEWSPIGFGKFADCCHVLNIIVMGRIENANVVSSHDVGAVSFVADRELGVAFIPRNFLNDAAGFPIIFLFFVFTVICVCSLA